jgi:hopanoid biosynthesis associated radical SAM protein HpnH
MKFPLRSTVQIGRYVASQKGKDRYPLVIMLEPTLGCNIACIGCGKIREYESNKARLTVDECLQSAVECPAPVISVCGGEPLIFKGIEEVVAGFIEMKRNIQLCTNALRLTDMLDRFEPNPRLTFVVHLDGMQEIHDYYPLVNCDCCWPHSVGHNHLVIPRAAGFLGHCHLEYFDGYRVGWLGAAASGRYRPQPVGRVPFCYFSRRPISLDSTCLPTA